MVLMDGKKLSLKLFDEIKSKVSRLSKKPGLAVILVGEDPASAVYVRNKHKACDTVGIHSEVVRLPASIQKQDLIDVIQRLNNESQVHGILVQLPLPNHLLAEEILENVNENKDVDGFHTINAGKLFRGKGGIIPCTPLGIIRLLEEYKIAIEGRHAVVIGRSNTVGKPVAQLLLQKNATITICHAYTQNIDQICRQADILVVAVGKPELVKGSWVKKGAAVIDVGINRKSNGELVGDVAFDEVSQIASYITPVPGGVGPMTIAMLLENTLQAYELSSRS